VPQRLHRRLQIPKALLTVLLFVGQPITPRSKTRDVLFVETKLFWSVAVILDNGSVCLSLWGAKLCP